MTTIAAAVHVEGNRQKQFTVFSTRARKLLGTCVCTFCDATVSLSRAQSLCPDKHCWSETTLSLSEISAARSRDNRERKSGMYSSAMSTSIYKFHDPWTYRPAMRMRTAWMLSYVDHGDVLATQKIILLELVKDTYRTGLSQRISNTWETQYIMAEGGEAVTTTTLCPEVIVPRLSIDHHDSPIRPGNVSVTSTCT